MFRWMVYNAESCDWLQPPFIPFLSSLSFFHHIIFRGSLRWDLSSFSPHTHTCMHTCTQSHTHTHTHTRMHTQKNRPLSRSINSISKALLLQIFSCSMFMRHKHMNANAHAQTRKHPCTDRYTHKCSRAEWRDGTPPCEFTSPVNLVNYACRGSLLWRWSGLGEKHARTHPITHIRTSPPSPESSEYTPAPHTPKLGSHAS